MTYIHLSIEEQKQALQGVLLNSLTKNVKWDHFSLNFQEILEVICDTFKENELLEDKNMCLEALVKKFGIPADPNMHFQLVKEAISSNSLYKLDSLYKLSLFDINDRKALLHIALQKIEEAFVKSKRIYRMDCDLFNLPFNYIFEVACSYKTSLRCFDGEFVFSVTSEIERIELFKKSVQLDLDNFFQYKDYFFEFLKISNPFNNQEKFYLLGQLLKIFPEDVNLEIFCYKFIDLDLSEETGILWRLTKELKNILQELEYGQNVVQFAESFKQKIFDCHTNQIWDNKNKELFSKELKFLSEQRNVNDEKTSFVFTQMADWLIYTVVLYNYLSYSNPGLQNIIEQNKDVVEKTFKEIRSFSNPSMRVKLTQLFLENVCNQQGVCDLYTDLVKDANQVSLLPTLIVVSHLLSLSPSVAQAQNINQVPSVTSSFIPQGLNNEIKVDVTQWRNLVKETLLKINKNRRKYKNGKHMRPLIVGLHAIFSQEKIRTVEEKFELANRLLEKDFGLHKDIWLLIGAIFMPDITNHPGFADVYRTMMKEDADFNLIFQQICRDVFKVTSEERIINYNKTFGTKHNTTALLTYYAKIQSLPELERTRMLEVLNKYFNSVLADNDENYKKLRYCANDNPQLKVIFEHHPDLKPKWEQGYSSDYQKFIEDYALINIVEKQFDLKSFVTKMIMRNHLSDEYCAEFKEYIKAQQKHKLEIKEQLEREKDTLRKKGHLEKNLQNRLNSCELQLELIEAIRNNYSSREEQANKLQTIMRCVANARLYCEFRENLLQAIRALARNRSKETTNYDGWKIVDTDDYWSMFMAGTDIEGSCQRVDGDPNLNKCLMGYVMYGDYRMLAIQNAQGITVARCIIHLLWDKDSKLANLFMEEAYPFYINYIQEQALIQLAINRARYLGLNLLSIAGKDADDLDYYINTLIRIKGGIAPWVYSDASHREMPEGEIQIKNAKFLFNLNKSLYLDKKQKLDAEALRYGVNVYQQYGYQQDGVFFSGSKHATSKQPYGPYSDRLCCPNDPITELAGECSKLSLTI